VAKQQGAGEKGESLGRLPPGRHGLSREFVTQNQRNRLTAGMIAAVAEHGYHDATISQITAAAGVSRRTFYSYFSSKEECFFDTYDVIADQLRAQARSAASPYTDWRDQVRARFDTTLEFFSSNPDLARYCLIAPSRAGDKIADRLRQAVDEVYEELVQGMPPSIAENAPSPAVQQSMIGGAATLVMEKVQAGEGENLTEMLTDLLELFLTPYLGREEAVRVARQGA
jgi:AcrR family transcriptional regulator